jgi:hypothetical protein
VDREGSVCVFVVFRFRGQSVSRAVSHKGGDETKRARLCFFAKTVSTRFLRARASFREDGKQSGSAVGRVGRSARFVSRVVGGADASRRSRLVAHLHDGRAVVRNGGHALVVVHELVQASRALRDRTMGGQRKYEIERAPEPLAGGSAARASSSATYQGGSDGVHHRHARVDVGNQLALALAGVRALAQEHDLGLLEGRGRGRQPRWKKQIAARETKKIWQLAPRRALRTRGVTARFPRRNERRGGRRGRTYDHLPVGHLHEARHGARP